MCLEDFHYFNLEQLIQQLQAVNARDARFLVVDYNAWDPHVKTSIGILDSLSVNGFRCFYFQTEFGLLPKFGKPYFGKTSLFKGKLVKSINLEIVDFGDEKSRYAFISEADQNLMLSRLMSVNNGKELSSLFFKYLDYGYAVLSTLCSMYGKGEVSKKLIQTVGKKVLLNYIKTFNETYYSIKALEIKFLVIFNGRFVNERAAASAARLLGIKIVYHEATRNSSYIASCFSPHSIIGYKKLAESLILNVDPEVISKDSRSWYESRIAGSDPYSAHFQTNWDNFHDVLTQNTGARKRISIFTTSDDEYLGLSVDWDLPQKQSQREWIAVIVKIALKHNYEVILRLHPNLKTKSKSLQRDWVQLSELDGLRIIGFNDRCNSYNLVRSSDLIVTCGSTIAMEAGFLGKPVLSVGTGIYDALNAVRKVQDLDLIEDIFKHQEFDFLIPDRMGVEIFGYVERNKFSQFSNNFLENVKTQSYFDKPSFINRVASKIYRDLKFRLL